MIATSPADRHRVRIELRPIAIIRKKSTKVVFMVFRKARPIELFMLAFFAKYNAILHDATQAVLHAVSRLHAYSMLQ
jgi:hypothetical protein